MTTTATHRGLGDLRYGALHVKPQDRDWSEGFGDSWEYVEAPTCGECGGYARWSRDEYEWRCPEHGEVDPSTAEGPMMNYAYPLDSLGDADDEYDAADRLRDLPLCIVRREGAGYGYDSGAGFELALTGGGMDLSWEICEAFLRLGFAPPLHFCDLPGMAGRGHMGGNGRPRREVPPRDAYIIGACLKSAEAARLQAERLAERLRRV